MLPRLLSHSQQSSCFSPPQCQDPRCAPPHPTKYDLSLEFNANTHGLGKCSCKLNPAPASRCDILTAASPLGALICPIRGICKAVRRIKQDQCVCKSPAQNLPQHKRLITPIPSLGQCSQGGAESKRTGIGDEKQS